MKYINSEFFRFVFFGTINTLSTYFIYMFLLVFVNYTLAYSVAYVIGIFISYYLNSKFTFNQPMSINKIFQYPLVYLAQYLMSVMLLRYFVEILNIGKILAVVLTMILVIPMTFIMSRFILKRK